MEVRQRMTLLDQMSVIHSSNLRDLLRVRDEEDRKQKKTLTLGSVLQEASEKRELATTAVTTLGSVLGCSIGSVSNGEEKREIGSVLGCSSNGEEKREIGSVLGCSIGSGSNGEEKREICSVLGCSIGSGSNGEEKRDVAAAAVVGRTLLDIIREEEGASTAAAVAAANAADVEINGINSSNAGSRISWKSLKDRLGLRRASAAAGSSSIVSVPTTDLSIYSPGSSPGEIANPPPERTENESPTSMNGNDAVTAGENAATAASSSSDPVRMDLAAALAAERRLRPAESADAAAATPGRMSLMTLLEETDSQPWSVAADGEAEAEGGEHVCCVCMVRNKGAAFIPCGHTFCRVCSRELWISRGDCPLCNTHILEILDIF
ncbi:uncharacterized protein LOC131246832 [Magnolia sinica]|uniref:uncharacterized protein LOC131246832 n=1 Tax=Magnolia sinica TaxID=86752 RepID=UPI002657F71B|nr:uncharacterized protein LOC131246832 [Magnolia sinica]